MERWMQSCRSDANILQTEDFIKIGMPVNYANFRGTTALHVACACGQERTVNLLLNHNAEVNSTDKLGWTPLMQAARNGHSILVSKLLALGADSQLETRYGANLLFLATSSNDIPTIEAVTKGISKIHLLKQARATQLLPLAIAIVFDNMSAVQLLLKINSDVNISSSTGLTPLMVACAAGHPIIVNFLLDNNAKLELSNCVNQTALDIAKLGQNNHIIRLLNGKRAEDEKLLSNRFHMRSTLSLNQQYQPKMAGPPSLLLWPSPVSHSQQGSERCDTKLSPASLSKVKVSNIPPPSYSDHILSSAWKSPNVCSNSPQTPSSNGTRVASSPQFSPYTKYHRNYSPLQDMAHPSTSTNTARSASRTPPAKWGADRESGYGSSMDQDYQIFWRRPTPSVGMHLSKKSPIDKPKEANAYLKVVDTPTKTDSRLKTSWSGLQRTLSRLKSPAPKRSFSPQARSSAAVSTEPTPDTHLELVLQEVGLARYAPLFIKQELDVETLLKLTADDLREIGISSKNCDQIILALNKLRGNQILLDNAIFKIF